MQQNVFDTRAFADLKVAQAFEALSNQIVLVFRLKSRGIDASAIERQVFERERDLRQWQEYSTLLAIRKRMLNSIGQE